MTTETIDKLYLELAQVTRATLNVREVELISCIRGIGRAVGCGHTEDADGRARLVRCVEERLASLQEVASWAQAVLTALNAGDVAKDSQLHHKLREVMISFRGSGDSAEQIVWLIERSQPEGQSPPQYWAGVSWTSDANFALKHATEREALETLDKMSGIAGVHSPIGHVAEHAFIGMVNANA